MYGFIWGLCLVDCKDKLFQLMQKKWAWKVLGLGCLSLICGLCYLKFKPIVFWGDYLLKIMLGLILLVLLLAVNTRLSFPNKINLFLGSISFEVYLTHTMIFALLNELMPNMSSGVFIATSLCLTIIVASMVKKTSQFILDKYYFKLNRRI